MNDIKKLAEEKGFISKYLHSGADKELNYYLWMCELQKWLIANYKIIITLEAAKAGLYTQIIMPSCIKSESFSIITINKAYSIDEINKCIENGVFEALNYINTNNSESTD